jgi:outer membrane protein insertion porin family
MEMFSLFELEYPLIRAMHLKWVGFFDMGNAWNFGDPFRVKMDYGFGFRLLTGLGLIRLEWGFPINRQDYENPVVFQFMIGPPF